MDFILESEGEFEQCGLEPRRTADEKRGVGDGVFLGKFLGELLGQAVILAGNSLGWRNSQVSGSTAAYSQKRWSLTYRQKHWSLRWITVS